MNRTTLALALAATVFLGACGVHGTEAPGLTGPSELALSVSMAASPDTIAQDGRSNSTITITARDANQRALSGVTFRLGMIVDNEIGDYGTLTTRTLTTGSDGKASTVYTAPPAPPVGSNAGSCNPGAGSGPVSGRCVQITATVVGTDFAGASTHSVQIHLTPTSIVVPPSSIPVAAFTVLPTAPAANSPTQFDASKSCAGTDGSGNCANNGTIVSYAWDFGDGGTATGVRPSHTFLREATFAVSLTVTNDLGMSVKSTQFVTVGPGAVPTPSFTSSPTTPVPGDTVFFDATQSKPGAGHTIVRYVWNFGDGTFYDSSVPTASHKYVGEGSFVVTLNVQDETGQTGASTGTVTVKLPTATP
jgi:PKD repeat protein